VGVDYAHELARRAVNLILVARWADVLERVAKELRDYYGIEVCVTPADLSDDSVREPSYSELELEARHVDLLANNVDSPCLAHLLNPIGRAWTKCYRSFAYRFHRRFPVFCRLMLRMGGQKLRPFLGLRHSITNYGVQA
jgi:hypothetical protein